MSNKTFKNLSIDDKISALSLCADILDYPYDGLESDIEKLNKLLSLKLNPRLKLVDLEAEYIKIFVMESQESRCVPYASWWLDGKLYGKSLIKIDRTYKASGYVYDEYNMKKPADNLSSMIMFAVILAEENKFKEFKEFTKFLTWIDDLANSLNSLSLTGKFYGEVVGISSKLISSIKEEI